MLLRPSSAFLALFVMLVAVTPVAAQRDDRFDALVETLLLREVMAIMHEEGVAYGHSLEGEMFPGQGGSGWRQAVAGVYDRNRMEAVFLERLSLEFDDPGQIESVIDFFGSDRGQRVLELEVTARRAMLDESVDEAARERLEELQLAEDPLLDRLRAFSDANELVETNVAGAMNSNVAFYKGLIDGGAFGFDMTEQQVLEDVWGQEDSIRAETETWLFSYLALAYQPLDPEDLEAYISFSLTHEGQALNRALFAAFDTLFIGISRDLGLAAARYMSGQDI